MPGSYCRVTIYPDERWPRFEVGYHPDFVKAISGLPKFRRRWERDLKYWEVDPMYLDTLIKTAQRVFNSVIVNDMGSRDNAKELPTGVQLHG